jgi:glycerate kinase
VKVVVAPNALKGSLSARAAAAAIAQGVRRAAPPAQIVELPIADGGDGTRELLISALAGEEHWVAVHDARGRVVQACYGLVDAGRTAVLDVASASGLAQLAASERDPLTSSSYGSGELMRAALASGCGRLLLGLGGSATVDGGLGLLRALGARAFDVAGRPLLGDGADLARLARFDVVELRERLAGCELVCLCDVENELSGPQGALQFAAQKGATPPVEAQLAQGLERLADVLERHSGGSVRGMKYGGAAGGIAATLSSLLGARLVSGSEAFLDLADFEARLAGAELAITAEGRLDAQSLSNKGPFAVARRARAAGVPTLLLAGSIAADVECPATPFACTLSISRELCEFSQAQAQAARWLAATSEHAARLYLLGRREP